MNKKIVTALLRLLFSIGVLFLLSRAVDLNLLYEYSLQVHLGWIGAAFLLLMVLRVVVAVKWRIILAYHDMNVPLGELVKIIFISTTIGQVLPAGVGVDIIRGYRLAKKYGHVLGTTATIVIDRIIGMFSLFFTGLVGAILAEIIGISTGLIGILAVINGVIVITWLNIHHLEGVIKKVLLRKTRNLKKINSYLLSLVQIIADKSNINKFLPAIFFQSLLIQFIRCGVFFLIYLGFGQSLNFMYFVVFIPIVFIITLIPISIGGLGIREGVLIFLFSSTGVPNEISIGVGLTSQFLQILAAVPVLAFWLFEK